jgi:hypothetical protein
MGQKEPPPNDRPKAINSGQSPKATLIHKMQVDLGSNLSTHPLKLSTVVSPKARIMNNFELERLSGIVKQTRSH